MSKEYMKIFQNGKTHWYALTFVSCSLLNLYIDDLKENCHSLFQAMNKYMEYTQFCSAVLLFFFLAKKARG